jgi:hypothetical protein
MAPPVIYKFIFSLMAACIACLPISYGQVITGKVADTHGAPVSYANVYFEGTTNGTTTNHEGSFRIVAEELPAVMVAKHLGYKMYKMQVSEFQGKKEIGIVLESENYTISEVVIRAQDEDPAMAIMRNAIGRRRFYLEQVREYSCDVYIKGVQKINEHPDRIFGIKVDLSEFLDDESGVIYLSESVSKYFFRAPGTIHEEMISSKVSGDNQAFSFNQASAMDINFYENRIDFGDISARDFISPLSSNAFFFYRFRLISTYTEEGVVVHKIRVVPKRVHDPVFKGHIYIQDSTWRMHAAELYINRDSQIEIIDSLMISQVYIPSGTHHDIWMRGSASYHFGFSFMGFRGGGDYVAVYSDYDVIPKEEQAGSLPVSTNFRKGELLRVQVDANTRDTTYWESVRPVPLTSIEARDYSKRDSLRTIRESDEYLDSIDHISNKLRFSDLLSGYTYRDRKNNVSYNINSPLASVNFNTVEGWNAGTGISMNKEFDTGKELDAGLNARYGFSNQRLSMSGDASLRYDPLTFSRVSIRGGSELVQYNGAQPISPFINSLYSLADRKNYMKLYLHDHAGITARRELFNGFVARLSMDYSVRTPVNNASDYSFADNDRREYTSNIPVNVNTSEIAYDKSNAFITGMELSFTPGQEYIMRPDVKYIVGSRYPTIKLSFSYADRIFGTEARFSKLEAGVEDLLDAGILGSFSYRVEGGMFLDTPPAYFNDFHHFTGNQTFVSSFADNRYDLLDYYSFSSNDRFISAHITQSFGGFLLNKVPVLRKLNLNEVVTAKYLHTEYLEHYYELGFGLEKLGAFRIDYVFSFDDNGSLSSGLVLGIKGLLGP